MEGLKKLLFEQPKPKSGSKPRYSPNDVSSQSTSTGGGLSLVTSDKYFCKKCKDSSGNEKTGNECDSIINGGGNCLEYDKEAIVADFGPIYDTKGRNRGFSASNIFLRSGKLYLAGESRITDGKKIEMELKQECNGNDCKWLFYDEEKEGGPGWINIKDYYTTSLHENRIIMKENMDRIPQMIDDKLREFNFYTVDPKKGKQKVSFTDEDREVMKTNFIDMSEKYPEDIAFIRAVVSCRDIDDKTNQPYIRLGSYRDSSNINLPFSKRVNGLEKVLDGGVNYFTVVNNPGPDNRDFKIVPGDKIKDVEFDDHTKETMHQPIPQQPMKKEEPFEQVMKNKERKGLSSLLEKGELSNDLTKSQKKIIEKLKREGYLFKQPVDEGGYKKMRVKSKEFTEAFEVWKKS
jgi:hypothetical protein